MKRGLCSHCNSFIQVGTRIVSLICSECHKYISVSALKSLPEEFEKERGPYIATNFKQWYAETSDGVFQKDYYESKKLAGKMK